MCLRTSTVVCQADVAHLDHWLLWRCDPVQFVLSTTFRNLAGNHLRAGALHLSLLSSILCTGGKLAADHDRGDAAVRYCTHMHANGPHAPQWTSQPFQRRTLDAVVRKISSLYDSERLRPPPVRTKENPSFCPVDMNMRMRGKDDAPARKKVAFWVSEGLSEHKSKGSQRHNSQWVEMSNIGLTTKVLVQRHIA